jgi:hypothetical protein
VDLGLNRVGLTEARDPNRAGPMRVRVRSRVGRMAARDRAADRGLMAARVPINDRRRGRATISRGIARAECECAAAHGSYNWLPGRRPGGTPSSVRHNSVTDRSPALSNVHEFMAVTD